MGKKITVGRLAHDQRIKLGLTIPDVVQRLRNLNDSKVSHAWVSQLENDQIRMPGARRLMRLESALELEFGYFLDQVGM